MVAKRETDTKREKRGRERRREETQRHTHKERRETRTDRHGDRQEESDGQTRPQMDGALRGGKR